MARVACSVGRSVRRPISASSVMIAAAAVVTSPSRDLVLQRPCGGGIPRQVQCGVDGNEGLADGGAAGDHDDPADMGGLPGQTLSDSHDLDLATQVDAERTGAALAGQSPNAGVAAEPDDGTDHQTCEFGETGRDPAAWVGIRNDPRERQRPLVEHGCTAAGEPLDGLVSGVPAAATAAA